MAEAMRIDEGQNLIIGNTASFTTGGVNEGSSSVFIAQNGAAPLTLKRAGGNGNAISFIRGGTSSPVGSISISTSATSFNTSSDYRLKENVVTDWDATSRLKQLKPSRFNFKADKDTIVDGFLAHEVSSIVPEAVTGEKDATEKYTDEDGVEKTRDVYQGIDQSKLVPLLVKTIQELEARIAKLEGD